MNKLGFWGIVSVLFVLAVNQIGLFMGEPREQMIVVSIFASPLFVLAFALSYKEQDGNEMRTDFPLVCMPLALAMVALPAAWLSALRDSWWADFIYPFLIAALAIIVNCLQAISRGVRTKPLKLCAGPVAIVVTMMVGSWLIVRFSGWFGLPTMISLYLLGRLVSRSEQTDSVAAS